MNSSRHELRLGIFFTRVLSSNAKQGPHTAFNAYKEFLQKDTAALFLAAALEHFGLKDVGDIPEGFIPDHIQTGSLELRRSWLHEVVSQVVDRFVVFPNTADILTGARDAASEQPLKEQELPCRMPGCKAVYKYRKARDNHERKQHGFAAASVSVSNTTRPVSRDHKKEHTEARLCFGLFLSNMQDAVKEGDGKRLLRLYTVALLFYKAYGHTQYAYSTLLLTLQVNAMLSPRLAHSLTWNRFWNGKGGAGKNISLDLHLEHLNNFLKSFLRHMGPNMTEQAADRISRSIGVLKDLMDTTDKELEVSKSSGIHHAARQNQDILILVEVIREAELFKDQPGREFTAFPKFDRDILSKLKYSELRGWMRSKLKEWRNLPI
ncbi:uncharacterized protein LOC143728177 [Siphateles boraxobius]|uniref:uncharacterized protein LOC143728177 n=1 Tax=Siphateles boraxobius TaxID=180520 RepID=UPI004062D317